MEVSKIIGIQKAHPPQTSRLRFMLHPRNQSRISGIAELESNVAGVQDAQAGRSFPRAQPRLRRYAPYEEYQRYVMPQRLAERVAELKFRLAWLADSSAWDPSVVIQISSSAADATARALQARDSEDWEAAIDAYRFLSVENAETLLTRQ